MTRAKFAVRTPPEFFFVVSEPGDTPFTLVAVATNYAPVSRTIMPTAASALDVTLDAVTRKPVDQFRYRTTYRYANGSGTSSGTGWKGTFSTTVNDAYTNVSLTIEATGYQPLTKNFQPDTGSSSNVYELKKAQMVEGVVLAPDGSPAVGTELVLLTPRTSATMNQPGKFQRAQYNYETVVADAAGRFELTPVADADLVLASHPTLGFVQLPAAEVLKTGKVTLQPWGHVHGVLHVGDKNEPSQYAAVHTHFQIESGSARTTAPLWIYYKLRPESDGRFAFDAVPPGERMVQLRYILQDKESGSPKLGHNLPMTVKAGETNDVVIGGTGRTVTGKVDVVGVAGLVMDWQRGTFVLRLSPAAMPSEIPPPLILPPNTSAAERQKFMQQHQDELSAFRRNRVVAGRLAQRTCLPLFDADGSFRIPSVPPGTYTLNVSPDDPRQPASTSRQLGSLLQNIVVPPGTAPFEAGHFELQARP